MISRITLRDFAVARDLAVEPGPHFNVFTGETGAGKSLLVDALAFAFGGRRGREIIASGQQRAVVQVEATIDGAPVAIERTISASGRTSARVNGEPATVEDLQRLGAAAVDVHGQSDQLGLLRPAVQRDFLDDYAGLGPRRAALATQVRELRDVRRAISALRTGQRERERRLDQLRFEVTEITDAGLQPGEDELLRAEQRRLAAAGALIEACTAALEALDSPALGEVTAGANAIVVRDPSASAIEELAVTFDATTLELGRELRRYRDAIDPDPALLEAIEARLDLIARLRRKYGDTIEAILAYGAQAAGELAAIEEGGTSLDDLLAREAALLSALSEAAAALSAARRQSARDLVLAVSAELEQLGMGGSRLAVGFEAIDDGAGVSLSLPDYDRVDAGWEAPPPGEPALRQVTESGVDRLEFLASFNPGQEPRPLALVASGGEASRFLLALSAVFAASAAPRSIVFDEVDEGVGGRAGALVGAALRRLSARHQVICITHLPQVAALGDRHFVVTKQDDGRRTWSDITPLEGEPRIAELAAMLGGVTTENLQAARALLAARDAAATPS